MIRRPPSRIALGLAGALALIGAAPANAGDGEPTATTSAPQEKAPVEVSGDGGPKDPKAGEPQAGAAASPPVLKLDSWWKQPSKDDC